MINILNTKDKDFYIKLKRLTNWDNIAADDTIFKVKKIINDVVKNGDSALVQLTKKYDFINASDINDLILSKQKLKAAFNGLSDVDKKVLITSHKRIKQYHKKQIQKSWTYEEDNGTVLGQKITALDKVGLYVPGGKASYPSSVLMNAVPAKVAGVKEIIMTVPTPKNEINPFVLAAAYIAGVDKVFRVGGAQAIAALAYGTKTIPKVDKIVGPGNIFVAIAKKLVFGQVGIDMIAGPSEILIICDGKTNPDWIAMDLFSQAEHDEDAQAILLTDNKDFINEVKNSIEKLLPTMSRKDVIKKSLQQRGILIKTKNLDEAVKINNIIAPEHLELSVENPNEMLEKVKNAGAIFLGKYSSESLGDYCAGPNHVLPTSGTARFSSPLGVYDFQKKSSIIFASKEGAQSLGKIAAKFANFEDLEAHSLSAKYRLK